MKSTVGNFFALAFGVAMVAIIAAKPDFLKTTFSGTSNVLGTAISPVTGRGAAKVQ
jgi:hypothetical protein